MDGRRAGSIVASYRLTPRIRRGSRVSLFENLEKNRDPHEFFFERLSMRRVSARAGKMTEPCAYRSKASSLEAKQNIVKKRSNEKSNKFTSITIFMDYTDIEALSYNEFRTVLLGKSPKMSENRKQCSCSVFPRAIDFAKTGCVRPNVTASVGKITSLVT